MQDREDDDVPEWLDCGIFHSKYLSPFKVKFESA